MIHVVSGLCCYFQDRAPRFDGFATDPAYPVFRDTVSFYKTSKIRVNSFLEKNNLAIWKLDTQPERRSEEHTSELQSLMRISYAVFCLKKNTQHKHYPHCQP